MSNYEVSEVVEGAVLPQSPQERIWGVSPQSIAVAQNMSQLYKIKHGMFACVPIICKGAGCPFFTSCRVDENYRVVGERCPQEIGAIMARYEYWCQHFKKN